MSERSSIPAEVDIKLEYRSKPFYQRPSFIPKIITVVGVSAVIGLLIYSALQHVNHYGAVAALVALSAALIAIYLGIFVYRWILELFTVHSLSLTDSAAIYSTDDRLFGKRNEVRIPFEQIEFVDDFAPREYASLIFHFAHNRIVEIPMWPMTDNPGPILQYLMEKHVRIVHV